MEDINQQVLDAFQVEHREHLEAIRALMEDLIHEDATRGESRLEEAFRRAHSMKGGARICALKPVEILGHRLETLFARMHQGGLRFDRDVVRAVNMALDMTEDWMASLSNHQTLPELDAALQAIDGVLASGPVTPPQSAPASEIAERLRAAFQVEHKEYVSGLRDLLAKVANSPGDVGDEELSEAFRMAHSLKGAARVSEVRGVERLSERLETLFSRVRAKSLTLDEQVCGGIAAALVAVEAEMAELAQDGTSLGPSQALQAMDDLLGTPHDRNIRDVEPNGEPSSPQPAGPAQQVDMVRVSTTSLDRLARSAGQLHTESLRQNQVERELLQLSRQIDEMQRDRESLRKAAGASLHQLTARPEFGHIGRYLDSVDSQIRGMASRTRRVRLLQRRGSWLLASLGQQVQQDVRQTRMAPAESVFQGFRKMVRDLARDEGKQVEFSVTGLDVLADRMVLQTLKDPLMHMLRNAVTHGIEQPEQRLQRGKSETGRIELRLDTFGNRLRVLVDDDGRGIDLTCVADVALRRGLISSSDAVDRSPDEIAKLIFQPGFSTSKVVTELSGRGIGLSVVYEAVARLQGEVQLYPKEGPGAAIRISAPLSIATHRLLFVACGAHSFAIPLHAVERLLRIKVADVKTVEGKPIVNFQRELVPLVSLAHLLGIGDAEYQVDGDSVQVAILRAGTRRFAIGIDACVAERDCLIREFDGPAATIPKFAGGVLLEDGGVALVINPAELIGDFKPSRQVPAIKSVARPAERRRPTVLVVDDSFTTRTLEKTLLEAHGYEVRIAVDGAEALTQLSGDAHGVDLIISDVQMPRLDGFGLLAEIKKNKRLASLPVILVTSLDKREDQERGLSLGADAYIVKRKFDHEDLLNTIRQIL
jgi:two-component system chemotaxis sensor kinase CheA